MIGLSTARYYPNSMPKTFSKIPGCQGTRSVRTTAQRALGSDTHSKYENTTYYHPGKALRSYPECLMHTLKSH